MNRQDAIQVIMETVERSAPVISTTGLISREIFERFDSSRNIYVPGSMGLASSIGLGLAITCPERQVIIVDGDASLLMNLGSIVTIGNRKPENLLHIVIDNGSYGSCSEEASMSDSAKLGVLADIVGYRCCVRVSDCESFRRAIMAFKQGPEFILARIELGGRRDFRRPLQLTEIKKRFIAHLHGSVKGEEST